VLPATRHKRTHPALTPAGEGWYSIYRPRRDGRLSWPRCLITSGRGIEPGTAESEVWGTPPKFVPTLSRLPCYTSHGKAVKFPRIIATSPTVIDTFVMDFKIIFEYSRLKIFGGPSSQFGVCARQPWSTSSVFKNLRGQHPQVPKFSLLKKST